MKNKIVILDDSVILYQHFIYDDKWEKVLGFPRGGLSYLISNNNIKFYAYIDYFYRNCLMTMDLPIYIVDEELGIDGEYSDIEEVTEILNRIFPALNGDVDLTPYLKKREAEETYQPIGDYLTEIPDNYVTDEDLNAVLEDYLTKDEADETYQPIGNYLTEHQPLKTINGQVISGTGNIEIDCSGGTVDAYTKAESDAKYQPKGIYAYKSDLIPYATKEWVEDKGYLTEHQPLKTINNQSLIGTGNIQIEGGGTITVDSALSTTSENPVQNKVITNKLNDKLDSSAYTAPVQSDWNATSGLAMIKNKPTIPTVPSNVSAFNNDAGYITESSQVFNNYYTTGDTYNKTQVDNYITNLQSQIDSLIDSYSECCTAMTLSGTAIIYATSASQIVDTGSITNVQIFASPNKTIYPAATGVETTSLGASGNVPCTFKLIEGLTYLGSGTSGRWTSIHAVKYQFNGGFTGIAQNCFSGDTRLQTLDFHDGLTEIREGAFDGCTALRTLIFRSLTPPSLYTVSNTNALDTLYQVNTSFVIKVPAASLNAYKSATGWSTYASMIEAI